MMELPIVSRKRPLCNGYAQELPMCKKKCLKTLARYEADTRTDRHDRQTSCGPLCTPEDCVNGATKNLTDTESFLGDILSWADTQTSVKKVLLHLKFKQATDDVLLDKSINKTFLEFQHDITEECGAEDKQHSWAVIEKQEEIIMYGPFYPKYNKGEHSEDIIIKQTQELLESEAVSEGGKVYVFTKNSPCLARNTDACMLNLVQKAKEWWTVYGVKTRIGYVKCWGFKGNKENVFRDIHFSQVDCIDQTEDYESYVKAAEETDLNPACENVFSAVKRLLRSADLAFINTVQDQDWKSSKRMHSIFEGKPEEEKDIQELNTMIEAAQVLLPDKKESLEEHLRKGPAFAFEYAFGSQVSDATQGQIRLTFQQCWKEMVQDKYAEFIREKLTEDFNQCTVHLFIKDIVSFTKEYLEIGRIQFPEEASQVPR
ncbi:uncharacterized protein LOC117492087 [Trematomus bernacchii]|uniref:uncharacterized protein LOC117492087 n=1 Tax=Trematomus bernacchii TaxID=40690 RepID=UPI00146D87E1|nr:uncharacterized protein LOC117492087 [Trematomus bernacchii]